MLLNNFTVEEQNRQLANDVLERNFYESFRTKREGKKIELYLTGACKANCEYCYLKKHQKDLYPTKLHSEELIIQNLQLVLDWYIKNEFICQFDIFSAEWLTTPLADKVFNCFYNTFSKVPKSKRPKVILMADNMQFLKSEHYTQKVESYYQKMEELGITLGLSASVDGKYCDFGRTENDDEYYQKLRDFMVKHKILIHPMISSNNIQYWMDNYVWWRTNFPDSLCKDIMSLEVRDNSWTDESIGHLIRFCDFLADYKFEEFNYDKEKMLKYVMHVFTDEDPNDVKLTTAPYNVIGIQNSGMAANKDFMSCSSYGTLPIRLGDLSVAPCHRLFYPELEMGKFHVENNEITHFEPTNISLLIMMCHLRRSCMPHCEQCKFNEFCVGHCLGASYEQSKNMLVPQQEVCKMYVAKNTFLIYKYYHMGLFEELDKIKDLIPENRVAMLRNLINDIVGGTSNDCQ